MKKIRKTFKSASIGLALLTISGILIQASFVYAGALTNPLYDRLNRLKADTASGVTHRLVFKTATAVEGGAGTNRVYVIFPDADDGKWVRTAGTLTLATSTCATEESVTGLPVGAASASSSQGSGASSYDQLEIWGMDDLAAATSYCVDVSEDGAALGTSASAGSKTVTVQTHNGTSAVDTGYLAESIIADDQVTVTATVDPTITFTLAAGGSTVALGTLSTTAIDTASSSVQTSTNAAYGYSTVVAYDHTLRIDASNDIDDTASGTVDVGYELYGMSTTDADQTILVDTEANCTTPGDSKIASGLSASWQSMAGATTGPVDETSSYCLAASISSTTTAGSYSHTLTFVSTAKF